LHVLPPPLLPPLELPLLLELPPPELLPLLLLPPLLLPPLLLPPLLLPLLLPPPPAQLTGSQSAGTTFGVQVGSLVCAWMHSYVAPSYVTSAPTEYGTHAAHAVAAAHCAALSAARLDCALSAGAEPQPTAAPTRTITIGRAVLEFMPSQCAARPRTAQESAWISLDPLRRPS
jgi:hypothetical protein